MKVAVIGFGYVRYGNGSPRGSNRRDIWRIDVDVARSAKSRPVALASTPT
jgi:hypothetical protein